MRSKMASSLLYRFLPTFNSLNMLLLLFSNPLLTSLLTIQSIEAFQPALLASYSSCSNTSQISATHHSDVGITFNHPCRSAYRSKFFDGQISSSSLHMYFDFQDDPIIIPQENYDTLLSSTFPTYYSNLQKQSLSSKFKISKSQIGHGYGLFASSAPTSSSSLSASSSYTFTAIQANEVAFIIPNNKIITLDKVKSHPTFGDIFQIMQADVEDDFKEEDEVDDSLEQQGDSSSSSSFGSIAILSAYLANEMLQDQCAIFEQDPSLHSPYQNYLSILPTGRAVSEQDHILWWSDEDIETVFQSSGEVYDKAMALRSWVDSESHIIEGMLVSDLAKRGMGLSVSQVRMAITNAFVNVFSRALFLRRENSKNSKSKTQDDAELVLVPVLDMCAHSNDPNLSCYLDESGNVICRAVRDIYVNEELTLKYYSTSYKGHEWYVMYGFIVPFGDDEEEEEEEEEEQYD